MPNPNAVQSSSANRARSSYYVWLSLPLLLLTYSVLGWFVGLHQFNWVPKFLWTIPQIEWWISVLGMVLLSAFVTAPLAGVRRWILEILSVDDWLFIACLLASLVLIFFFIHMDVVIKLIVLTAALLLARFDLVNLRWSGWSAFVVLSLVGGVGLGLGGWAHWATIRYDVSPWADVERNALERLQEGKIRSHPSQSSSSDHDAQFPESKSIETEYGNPKPIESKPIESKPIESKPIESSESKSSESKPAKTSESHPIESKPAASNVNQSTSQSPQPGTKGHRDSSDLES